MGLVKALGQTSFSCMAAVCGVTASFAHAAACALAAVREAKDADWAQLLPDAQLGPLDTWRRATQPVQVDLQHAVCAVDAKRT